MKNQRDEEFEKNLKQMKKEYSRLALALTSSLTPEPAVIAALNTLSTKIKKLSNQKDTEQEGKE